MARLGLGNAEVRVSAYLSFFLITRAILRDGRDGAEAVSALPPSFGLE